MLGLHIGDGGNNCRCHYVYYGLQDKKVHDLKVNCDFRETDNCFEELVCVCKPREVIEIKGSGCCYSYFSPEDAKKKGISLLGSSYAIDEFLQGGIDARSLIVACIALKLVDCTGKAFALCWKGEKATTQKIRREKGGKKLLYAE